MICFFLWLEDAIIEQQPAVRDSGGSHGCGILPSSPVASCLIKASQNSVLGGGGDGLIGLRVTAQYAHRTSVQSEVEVKTDC
jgi:hypothetical protein